MNLSGILVLAPPLHQDRVTHAIGALGWAEVHHSDDQGRMIVILEAETSEEGLERLKTIQRIPGVLGAEMVIHCFEDEPAAPAAPAADAAARLNDDERFPQSHYSRLKAWSNF